MKKPFLAAFAALLLTFGLSAKAQVAIRIGPPPVLVERRPPPPFERREWVWRNGYYRWHGGRYVWIPGEYIAPPRRGAFWVDGRWVRRPGGWYWREGRWR